MTEVTTVRAQTAVSSVHVVLPDGIDDLTRPSGGNTYDRRVCRGLAAAGWDVREHAVPGSWPWPDAADTEGLAKVVAGLPNGATVLIDGLIASTMPAVLVPQARRLRLVVLVHMPLGDGPPGHTVTDADTREGAVLSAASAIITTSSWTRGGLIDRYGLRSERVHVAPPGAETASLAPGSVAGDRLLCVAAVTPHKGHDVLLSALTTIADLPWHCRWVGSLDRDPDFVERLRRQAQADGVADRIDFVGPRSSADLDREYAESDALVLASHAETYGMVVTEALARGLPVIATAVGGLPEALGHTVGGRRPGLLVTPGDQRALTAALCSWLRRADLRQRLRHAARDRRTTLSGWTTTTERIASVLSGVAP